MNDYTHSEHALVQALVGWRRGSVFRTSDFG